MGKGYHSKSPEEFREFLEDIKKNQKKAFWKQFIIFVDIIIIMVIFYVVYQIINPGSMNLTQKSVVENFQGMRMSLTASQIHSQDGALLYLVAENKTPDLISIPGENWKIQYKWITEDGVLCSQGNYIFVSQPKPIPPTATALQEILIPPPHPDSSPNPCKREEFTKRKLFGIGSFQKRILKLKVLLNDNSHTEEFEIEINPFSGNP